MVCDCAICDAQCAQEKCDVFKPGDHASTFGGNPLACAAGLVVASRITDGGLLENVKVRMLTAATATNFGNTIAITSTTTLVAAGAKVIATAAIVSAAASALLPLAVLPVLVTPLLLLLVSPPSTDASAAGTGDAIATATSVTTIY
jgi:acetylornithine/N-succinyldiaminopimelate aminotransferase